MLSACTPLAMNMFVPSMPSIAADLGTSYAAVQLGLSLYLAATAVIPLIAGPISDRYGRRPVLIVGLVIFLVGTVVCTYAETVTAFLTGRLLQTASAAGIVLSRAIVRDVYPREKSASMIGYIVMGMAIAPMIG
ncbi:MAG: MFS transporter, partial [Pseudomonadota bacterium]